MATRLIRLRDGPYANAVVRLPSSPELFNFQLDRADERRVAVYARHLRNRDVYVYMGEQLLPTRKQLLEKASDESKQKRNARINRRKKARFAAQRR